MFNVHILGLDPIFPTQRKATDIHFDHFLHLLGVLWLQNLSTLQKSKEYEAWQRR